MGIEISNANIELNNSSDDNYKILVVDNDMDFTEYLSVHLKRLGYLPTVVINPLDALNLLEKDHFDILILNFYMKSMHGDKVIEKIRKFNKELYILLLTDYKDLSPSIDTIKRLDIQGYWEKNDKLDHLILLIESGIKYVSQIRQINEMNKKLTNTYNQLQQSYLDSVQTIRHTVEAKDRYTIGHSDRVSEYSVLIGKKLNLPDSDLQKLRLGGLFHDVGKIRSS